MGNKKDADDIIEQIEQVVSEWLADVTIDGDDAMSKICDILIYEGN